MTLHGNPAFRVCSPKQRVEDLPPGQLITARTARPTARAWEQLPAEVEAAE